MVKKTTLKLFLTSGITLTVGEDEKITVNHEECDLSYLAEYIRECVLVKHMLEFTAVIDHTYVDGEETKVQKVTHHYCIPVDKISWFMIEEV